MIIKAITFNVRGLNEPRKIERLRQYFQNMQGGADIIMLQEHKLRGEKAGTLGKLLFPNGKCWIQKADQGYNINGSEGAGRGGICTFLNNKLTPLVTDQGNILGNKAFWICLQGLPGGDLGILNIYAPNESRARIVLWQELTLRLPTDYKWLVSGDFNMVENAQDKSALCSKTMPQGEKIVSEAFKSSLHLADTFNHNGRLRFSWDNRRRDGGRILGRLDQHYVSSFPPASPRTFTHAIISSEVTVQPRIISLSPSK